MSFDGSLLLPEADAIAEVRSRDSLIQTILHVEQQHVPTSSANQEQAMHRTCLTAIRQPVQNDCRSLLVPAEFRDEMGAHIELVDVHAAASAAGVNNDGILQLALLRPAQL